MERAAQGPQRSAAQREPAKQNGWAGSSPEELRRWYYLMLLIRRFEEKAGEMYTRARIGGYTHLNIGEEATVVGAITALRPDDPIFSNYREHGHAMVRGVDPKAIMAELFGKETGVAKGRGGSMHIFDAQHNFYGGYAIVGGPIALATGAALAMDYQHSDRVVACILGEGSTNIGYFYESLNMAALWQLPVVYLCVNNQYAMGARVGADSAVTEIYRKACAFGMASGQVDGMDVIAVHQAMQQAVQRARQEHQPTLLESICYRYRGHSMADPARYRTEEELKEWLARDPIPHFRRRLAAAGLLSDEDATRIEEEADLAVAEAVNFAEQSPEPSPADLERYVYAQEGSE